LFFPCSLFFIFPLLTSLFLSLVQIVFLITSFMFLYFPFTL
jgi:hypothetical protein